MAKIKIKTEEYTTSGNRKSIYKVVELVNQEKDNGWAFNGTFTSKGENMVEVGAYVLEKRPMGSVKNSSFVGVIWEVQEDAEHSTLEIGTYDDVSTIGNLVPIASFDYFREFFSLRDKLTELLEQREEKKEVKEVKDGYEKVYLLDSYRFEVHYVGLIESDSENENVREAIRKFIEAEGLEFNGIIHLDESSLENIKESIKHL